MSLKAYKQVLVNPLVKENPITLQILGICSALAVTSNLNVTLIMCVALTTVVSFSNLFYFFNKKLYPIIRKDYRPDDNYCFSCNCSR